MPALKVLNTVKFFADRLVMSRSWSLLELLYRGLSVELDLYTRN